MTPPSSAAQRPNHPAVEAWHNPPKHPTARTPAVRAHRTTGPMEVQQQQQQYQPQRMQQQRSGTGGKPKPVSREQADKARKELEKKGQVLPDGSKKKPLPGEIAGTTA